MLVCFIASLNFSGTLSKNVDVSKIVNNIVFSNAEEIGYPAALYFFFGAPFYRKAKSSFDYEFSFGLSHNWKPYDRVDKRLCRCKAEVCALS